MGLRVAHKKALEEQGSRVIIIKKGEIGRIDNFEEELKAYLNTNIFLNWGESRFYQKLRLAIVHPLYLYH